jgi:hypothetical protein
MNRRRFFSMLFAAPAAGALALNNASQHFANGGLVEAPQPAPLVGEAIHVHHVIDERRLAETIEEVMREHRLRMHLSSSL